MKIKKIILKNFYKNCKKNYFLKISIKIKIIISY